MTTTQQDWKLSTAARERLGASRQPGRTDRLGIAATSRRGLALVLSAPCTRHEARSGEPCWTMPGDGNLSAQPHIGVCGRRITAAYRSGHRQ